MNHGNNGCPAVQSVRCAVYTRKSTEEGLNQAFNSLDAQRESAQSYIASQQHQGWLCLPEHYDDGGFTGGNLDRPALKRLLDDIQAGRIDCVLVYKVDRLSRSLLDFAKLMELFAKHQASFVSVTQQFNTATSMGRLLLNVLLSFAQFERELIAERTRDKIAAARRKGKWVGGMPFLGYQIDAKGSRLKVLEKEAVRVRAIFALYLERRGLTGVVRELARRGWKTKRWQTRDGKRRGGRRFTRGTLRQLLSNVTYLGKVRYKDEAYPGEHPAIVDPVVWQQVQELLEQNRLPGGGEHVANGATLLQGLLRCVACGCGMVASHSTKGGKRYHYYLCARAQKQGWRNCPAPSVSAAIVEQAVIEQIRALTQDNRRGEFAACWSALELPEQGRLLRRLVERIDHEGIEGKITLVLRDDGTEALAAELAKHSLEHSS